MSVFDNRMMKLEELKEQRKQSNNACEVVRLGAEEVRLAQEVQADVLPLLRPFTPWELKPSPKTEGIRG